LSVRHTTRDRHESLELLAARRHLLGPTHPAERRRTARRPRHPSTHHVHGGAPGRPLPQLCPTQPEGAGGQLHGTARPRARRGGAGRPRGLPASRRRIDRRTRRRIGARRGQGGIASAPREDRALLAHRRPAHHAVGLRVLALLRHHRDGRPAEIQAQLCGARDGAQGGRDRSGARVRHPAAAMRCARRCPRWS